MGISSLDNTIAKTNPHVLKLYMQVSAKWRFGNVFFMFHVLFVQIV